MPGSPPKPGIGRGPGAPACPANPRSSGKTPCPPGHPRSRPNPPEAGGKTALPRERHRAGECGIGRDEPRTSERPLSLVRVLRLVRMPRRAVTWGVRTAVCGGGPGPAVGTGGRAGPAGCAALAAVVSLRRGDQATWRVNGCRREHPVAIGVGVTTCPWPAFGYGGGAIDWAPRAISRGRIARRPGGESPGRAELTGRAVTSRRGKLLARHRAAGRGAGAELTRGGELTRVSELPRSGRSARWHAGAGGELAWRHNSRWNGTGSRLLLPVVRGPGRAAVSRRELPLGGRPRLERGTRRHGPHRPPGKLLSRILLSRKLLPGKLLPGKLLSRSERPGTGRPGERPGARGPISGPGRAGLPEPELVVAGKTPSVRLSAARSSVGWPSPVLRAARTIGIGGARVRLS